MICAASFSGDHSREQAEELATEIRTHYTLPAYVFNRTAEERRIQRERVAREKAIARKKLEMDGLPTDTPIFVKTVSIKDQYAVLIGGYKDDVIARKELEKIRKLSPSEKFAVFAYMPDPKTGKVREMAVNPFQSAFVCRNPTVPVEKPQQDSDLNERLKEYNAHEPYSLLKCSKPYTLVVKAYKCAATLESQTATTLTMSKWGLGRKAGDVMTGNERRHTWRPTSSGKHHSASRRMSCTPITTVTSRSAASTSPDDPRLIQTMQYFLKELNRPGSGVYQLHMLSHSLTDPMPMPVPHVK